MKEKEDNIVVPTVPWLKALRSGKGKGKWEATLQFPQDGQDKLETSAGDDLFGEQQQLFSQRQYDEDLAY